MKPRFPAITTHCVVYFWDKSTPVKKMGLVEIRLVFIESMRITRCDGEKGRELLTSNSVQTVVRRILLSTRYEIV